MRTIWLHIGTEKTGSTAIQMALGSRRADLARHGFLYSTAAGENEFNNHLNLCAYAREDDGFCALLHDFGVEHSCEPDRFRSEFRVAILNEVFENHDTHALIYSNEHLSSRLTLRSELERLSDLLWDISADIRVLVYLRRQDDLFLAAYWEALKAGGEQGPLETTEQHLRLFDYEQLLNGWASVFGLGQIHVRLYPRDIVQDFLHTVGLEGIAFDVPRVNRSLDAKSVALLQRINPHLRGLSIKARWQLVSALELISDGVRFTLADEILDEFMARFSESNRRVAEKFGLPVQSSGDPLFGDAIRQEGRTPENITCDELIEHLWRLWMQKEYNPVWLADFVQEGVRLTPRRRASPKS